MTEQYWISRADIDGVRYVRLSDVIGFLLFIADRRDGEVAEQLRWTAASISALLGLPDLEPRRDG